MVELTRPTYREQPLRSGIVHFGVGNFHRSHQAMFVDKLLELGVGADWAICGVGLLPGDAFMRDDLVAQDYLYTLVERDADEIVRARQVGSIIGYLFAPDDPDAVTDKLVSAETRIVSLTITEGGYGAPDGNSPSAFDYIVDALRRRRDAGLPPFTVVSCDNIESNGSVARDAVIRQASRADPGFADWIAGNVLFPNSMVDRITPATTAEDRALVAREFGISDLRPVVSEAFVQWVVEDTFSNGRPPLERVGVQIVDDVAPYERMKLRILNGSHQVFAYLGLLAGYRYVHEAVEDPILRDFVSAYIVSEAIPTVGEVAGVDLDGYRASVLHRFENRAIADTLIRIATDGSDRLLKFVLPVVNDLVDRDSDPGFGAFVVAAFATVCGTQTLVEEVPDRQRERLNDSVGRLHCDPASFLDDEALFGAVGKHESFRRKFVEAWDDIHLYGVMAAAERLARPNS